jgi:pimeloyl-ACP methyl ester carboxylesterase
MSLSRPSRTRWVATRAGSLAYDEMGDGPPVVLLAAGAHDRHDWDLVRPALSAHARTIALDWPGHGESAPPALGWLVSAPGFADVLEDVVDALELEPAAFVGNSVGGFASARMAIERPEQVRALVLVDSGGFTAPTVGVKLVCRAMGHPATIRAVTRFSIPWYMRSRTDEARAIEANARAMAGSEAGSAVMAGLWATFAESGHDLRERATTITAPTLVVWGEHDPVISPKVGRRVAATIAGAKLVTFDAGHLPHASQPTGFAEAVVPFLERAFGEVSTQAGEDRTDGSGGAR